ncbi:alpha/beta hydrolase [Mycobacterium xenopi]|uniref:Lipase n=1 Tax=Mycobacterium xenopi TaxID=1789 RepID=A0AAD1H2A2_MYCXE|nr:alpha/beta hydrolase [Mycobacterium xenopi]MDA3638071.1 alpha/beta hydrolase [Mycobacterium xenopi]MDA3656139.1 alpha/beta hydrolase [Mycobacterium xenopi]MDA3660542.1 alpha/beta hydrolase [Mycobacterium xenopi]ORX09493.1 lipase [Mycobacterium xenopi]SPX88777.1 lipase [Mycobacterium xenopi]
MPSFDKTGPAIDPILLKVLDKVPFRFSADDGVEVVRQRLHDLPRRPVHPDLRVEDTSIGGPAGTIGIRIYWPTHALEAALPVVLYFHGGGFVAGDLDTHDGTCRQHAVGADAVVVSVDYRLAPEHPYPAAVEDAWAATQWLAEHGDELGADPARCAVAGDSAGGTLSAVVAQRARDEGGPPLAFQLLWYPSTLWDTSLPSFTENASAPILDRAAVAAFSRWYAGELDLANPPPGLAPGRAANLGGLPPAYIAVAGHDPLRDDGIRYGELLAAAGVPVEVHSAETLVHGYLGYAGVVPAATEAMDRGLVALRKALHHHKTTGFGCFSGPADTRWARRRANV